MTDATYASRLDRVENSVSVMSNALATLSTKSENIESGLSSLVRAVEMQSQKLDNSRTGIGHIWQPLAVLFGIIVAVAGALAGPQIARIANVENALTLEATQITELRLTDARDAGRREAEAAMARK